MNAGVWVLGAGLEDRPASVVATDGTIIDGPNPEAVGGFSIIEVPSRQEALEWAAKIAVACRCAQEVRELMPEPPQALIAHWSSSHARCGQCAPRRQDRRPATTHGARHVSAVAISWTSLAA